MPTKSNDIISDEMYIRYRADVAETEALIAAFRTSRERAERFSNNSGTRKYSIRIHKIPQKKTQRSSNH